MNNENNNTINNQQQPYQNNNTTNNQQQPYQSNNTTNNQQQPYQNNNTTNNQQQPYQNSNTTNNQQQPYQNQTGQISNANIPQQSNNKKNRKTILIVIAVLIVIFILYNSANKSTSTNNQQNGTPTTNNYQSDNTDTTTLYKTVSAKDLADKNGTDYYKEYINKKIKITDLVVSISDGSKLIKAPGLKYFYINCNNDSSLNINDGDSISITGIVEDSVWTRDGNFQMKNCTID